MKPPDNLDLLFNEKFWDLATKVILLEDKKLFEELAKR